MGAIRREGAGIICESATLRRVGVLALLSLPRTRHDPLRMLAVAASAGGGSLLIAVRVLVLEIGSAWQWPAPSDGFPALGCVLGVSASVWV